jgi:hypothetical protein
MAAMRNSLNGTAQSALAAPRLEYASVNKLNDPCIGKPVARCR